LLAQAKDISAVKDVLTGDASNQGQVGTTMALIEQGLMVYTAIYKSIYRSAGEEFMLIFDNIGSYGGEAAAEDYMNVLDDPEADFAKDFAEKDMDIVPTADPASVTQMQRVAKAQAIGAVSKDNPAANQREVLKRQYEALGAEDVDALLVPENAPPPPMAVAQTKKVESEAALNEAKVQETGAAAQQKIAQAEEAKARAVQIGTEIGLVLGQSESGDNIGGLPAMEGPPGNAMAAPGFQGDGGHAAGGMDNRQLG